MIARITDRKTKQMTIFRNITSAITHTDYIAIYYIDEDGRKDCDVFNYREAEVQLLSE